jgi:hypothetical protein
MLGQIHLSGFFFQLALVLWALLLDLKPGSGRHTYWVAWAAGSAIATIPLYPWVWAIVRSAPQNEMLEATWFGALKLKFFLLWFAIPIGLSSIWDYFRADFMSFLRDPVILSRPCLVSDCIAWPSGPFGSSQNEGLG